MRNTLLLGAFVLTGCAGASTTPALDARVHALEVEVADLRAAANARVVPDGQSTSADGVRRATDAMMRAASATCKDVSIPSSTQINLPVSFDVGKTNMHGGDRITITEVLGSRSDFAVGGVYVVRGEYTLRLQSLESIQSCHGVAIDMRQRELRGRAAAGPSPVDFGGQNLASSKSDEGRAPATPVCFSLPHVDSQATRDNQFKWSSA